MSDNKFGQSQLDIFISPIIGHPTWGAKQGYGAFLSLEFGEPKLQIIERHSETREFRRDAIVSGRWSVWIYCCDWRFSMNDRQVAWSEDSSEDIARATGRMNGQKLLGIHVDPAQGRSKFEFDLGGRLETWPFGDDPTEEQWFIYGPENVFAYRADGLHTVQSGDTSRDLERWLPLV